MNIKIVDSTTFQIVATATEVAALSDIDALVIDTYETYVCSSEPSQTAKSYWVIKKEDISAGTLFNVDLTVPDTIENGTNSLLFIFLRKTDNTYYYLLPAYNPVYVLDYVAQNSGLLQKTCGDCGIELTNANLLILYYSLKLAISIQDYNSAIWAWKKIFADETTTISKCSCKS